MDNLPLTSEVARFQTALDALVDLLRDDRSILAAVLCGSLSHDTVWARSDIDLVLVTADDKSIEERGRSLDADGINVHAMLTPRAQFRQLADGSIRNSFIHSLLAKGRLLYTHDDTIRAVLDDLREIGARDTQIQLLRSAVAALASIYKAHKWMITRGDLHYTALWILYAATPLAQIEVVGRRLVADREVILQALALDPAFFSIIYTDLLSGPKTRAGVQAALDAIDRFMADRAPTLFAPVLEHLREAGEARSCTEIERHFDRHFGVSGVTGACEYLADQGIIGRAATAARLTKRSSVAVQELAFFVLD